MTLGIPLLSSPFPSLLFIIYFYPSLSIRILDSFFFRYLAYGSEEPVIEIADIETGATFFCEIFRLSCVTFILRGE
jgi:hypothetical protein